jgi:type 1 fimbria pilin
MKKILVSVMFLTIISMGAAAQKYYTKNGSVAFYSKASMENIDATNNQALSVLNMPAGDLQFSVLIKSFHFQKALMEEHFNENYLESDKYPKATFKGKITDPSKVDLTKDGTYSVTASGDLTIHGVTKNISTPATISVKAGKVSAKAEFNVALADYKVSIPSVVKNNISETVKVTVICNYDKQ